MPSPQHSHPSARLGLLSLITGILGSAIAYLGLWLESDGIGLAGFSLVAIALIGAIGALVWNLAWNIRRKWRDSR